MLIDFLWGEVVVLILVDVVLLLVLGWDYLLLFMGLVMMVCDFCLWGDDLWLCCYWVVVKGVGQVLLLGSMLV